MAAPFIDEADGSQKERKKRRLFPLIVIALLALVFGSLCRPSTHVIHEYVSAVPMMKALHEYKARFGSFPAGDSRAIWAAMRGDNPDGKVFFEFSNKYVLEPFDSWGNPYRFYFSADEVLIRSAGKNGHFDDSLRGPSDDLIYSRKSTDYIQTPPPGDSKPLK